MSDPKNTQPMDPASAGSPPPPENDPPDTKDDKALAQIRFTNSVIERFQAEAGSPVSLTEREREIAQHIYLWFSNVLVTLNDAQKNENRPPINFKTIDMDTLAVDVVKAVQTGLDPYTKNFLQPFPRFMGGRWKIFLIPGYAGMMYHIRRVSEHPIKDIIHALVHEGERFVPIYADANHPYDTYIFEAAEDPFAEGKVRGGFGYVLYEDESLNKLYTFKLSAFEKAKNSAPGKDIWNAYPEEMMKKTILRRLYDLIPKDPNKGKEISAFKSMGVGVDDAVEIAGADARAALEAGEVIDVDMDELREVTDATDSDQ